VEEIIIVEDYSLMASVSCCNRSHANGFDKIVFLQGDRNQGKAPRCAEGYRFWPKGDFIFISFRLHMQIFWKSIQGLFFVAGSVLIERSGGSTSFNSLVFFF